MNSLLSDAIAAGQVLAVRRFDPYGVPLVGDGGQPYGYSGESWDAGTELVYLRARYLRPALGLVHQPRSLAGDVRRPGTLQGYTYAGGNPLRFADSSGHWSEEALQAALGKDWRDTYFGIGAAFGGRDKLLAFLTSDHTTSDLTLSQVQSFFQGAGVLRGLGSDLSNFDAMGMRLSGNVGVGAFAAVSVDAILNLSSGEFSYFASPEVGVLLGNTVQIVGGTTLG